MEIDFSEWEKLDLRVGKIMSAKRVPRTDKLYKIAVDIGEKSIQIISSLVDHYSEEELEGKLIVVFTNLKPTKFAGEVSEGMLICAEKDEKCVLLTPEKDIEPGSRIT